MNKRKLLKTKYGEPSYILYASTSRAELYSFEQVLYSHNQEIKNLKQEMITSFINMSKLAAERKETFCTPKLKTLYASNSFINLLPFDIIVPSIIIDIHGVMNFGWKKDANNNLYIAISEDEIYYAATINGKSRLNSEIFTGELPAFFLDIYGQIYS